MQGACTVLTIREQLVCLLAVFSCNSKCDCKDAGFIIRSATFLLMTLWKQKPTKSYFSFSATLTQNLTGCTVRKIINDGVV